MSCSKPLIAFVRGVKENGKKDLYFVQAKKFPNSFLDPVSGKYVPNWVRDPVSGNLLFERLEIPCGQCLGCRLQYSRQWADRCMMELEDHDTAYFLTLTYDDKFINQDNQIGRTRRYYSDPETGEAKVSLSLCKDDLQRFWKRVRRNLGQVRYYACGEYGDKSKRPHYHAIVYDLKLPDLKFYKFSGLKNRYYTSDILNKQWIDTDTGVPCGFIVVGEVSWETCAYTARYVMKKAKGVGADIYDTFNMEPEFVVMSRRPGIGAKYYDRHYEDFLNYGECYINTDSGSVNCKTPRYFKNKLDNDFHDAFQEIRERSILSAKDRVNAKLHLSDYELDELREIEEYELSERSKALKREL